MLAQTVCAMDMNNSKHWFKERCTIILLNDQTIALWMIKWLKRLHQLTRKLWTNYHIDFGVASCFASYCKNSDALKPLSNVLETSQNILRTTEQLSNNLSDHISKGVATTQSTIWGKQCANNHSEHVRKVVATTQNHLRTA